jgi:hypothetical protein
MTVFSKQSNDTYNSVGITISYIIDRTYEAVLSETAISQYPYTALIQTEGLTV